MAAMKSKVYNTSCSFSLKVLNQVGKEFLIFA